MGYLTQEELQLRGFAHLGMNVLLSDKASIHNASLISLGDSARIDDFCVLSAGAAGIFIGRHVHVAVACTLIGAGRISLADFSGLSARVSINSSSDDYSGKFMTNPTVPSVHTNVTDAPVFVGRHVIVGTGSAILPGVTLHDGCAVGALSLIRSDCEPLGLYFGSPARRIGWRERNMFEIESTWQSS